MDAYLVTNRNEGTLGTCKENRHPKLVEIFYCLLYFESNNGRILD
jgi:hypothetical protein